MLEKIKDGNGTRKCMKAYLEWNKYCLKASSWSYRLEDLGDYSVFSKWIEKTNLVSTRDSEGFWERASEFSNKYKEMDKISKDAKESEMGFFKFFEEIYYPKKVKISKSKSKINLRINLAVSRSIAVPHLKKINDTFGEKTMDAKFTEIVKKRLKKDFP